MNFEAIEERIIKGNSEEAIFKMQEYDILLRICERFGFNQHMRLRKSKLYVMNYMAMF